MNHQPFWEKADTLWADRLVVKPVRNYFPLTMRVRRALRSVNWGMVGMLVATIAFWIGVACFPCHNDMHHRPGIPGLSTSKTL